jgi:hypothetical protein
MKFIKFIPVFLIMVLATTSAVCQDYYGKKITDKDAVNTDELVRSMEGKTELATKVEGKVAKVCQVKGCWMTMELPEGRTMRVSFKDYAFFVPKDISGKQVVIEGNAKIKTTSVEELKHYAEDAGTSDDEIAKINSPLEEMVFEAEGVIVK